MTISEATCEFQIRLYLWAKKRAAEEMREEFPHFWLFKGGLSWKYYRFVRMLEKTEQELFVSAHLRRSHRYAAKHLGEINSPEENAVEEPYFNFREFSPFERELAIRRRAGEKVKFASKSKVQKAMIATFQKAFGAKGLETSQIPGYPVPFLRMKFSGWLVQTNFFFGRSSSLIQYNHLISSEERISHPTTPGVTGPALLLQNALCWTWMANMQWDYLNNEDVEPACDSVITLCHEFFDELPKLLKGIEREKVISD